MPARIVRAQHQVVVISKASTHPAGTPHLFLAQPYDQDQDQPIVYSTAVERSFDTDFTSARANDLPHDIVGSNRHTGKALMETSVHSCRSFAVVCRAALCVGEELVRWGGGQVAAARIKTAPVVCGMAQSGSLYVEILSWRRYGTERDGTQASGKGINFGFTVLCSCE
jgi:hypothetical protein